MKKILLYVVVAAIASSMIASCAATKKDCHGVKHYKHKGGFYI